MLKIADGQDLARALDSPIPLNVKALLIKRRDQLLADTADDFDLGNLAQFVVVDPADTITDIERSAGYPVVTSPAFEWVADHGGWFEAVTILSDDGFGVVLLVPDRDDIAHELLVLLRRYAQEPPIAP